MADARFPDFAPDSSPETGPGSDAPGNGERDRSRPWIDEHGLLVVPAQCEPKWRWWTAGGMTMDELLTALEVTKSVWLRYSTSDYPEELAALHYPLVSGRGRSDAGPSGQDG